MTSLAQQLSLQATQQIKRSNQTPSVLYTVREAGAYDLEHVYILAVQGFRKLQAIEPHLHSVEDIISPEQKGLTRGSLTVDENQRINNLTNEALLVLSQYFTRNECLYVVEYLLRNFRIHEYQPELTFIYFLQYHFTPQFTRLLQNMVDDHRNQNDLLAFAYDVISKGEQISRDHLIKQISSDYRILSQLITYTTQIIQKNNSPISEQVFFVQQDGLKISHIKPDLLSFVFSVLMEVQSKLKNASYVENVRGLLGKLIKVLFNHPSDSHLAFTYLLITQQLRYSKNHWLNIPQLAEIGTILTKNYEQFQGFRLYDDIVSITQTLTGADSIIKRYVEKLNESRVPFKNHHILHQALHYYLQQSNSSQEIDKKLIKWTKSTLEQYSSKHFLDQVAYELKQSLNLELSQKLQNECKQSLLESKQYLALFNIPIQKLVVREQPKPQPLKQKNYEDLNGRIERNKDKISYEEFLQDPIFLQLKKASGASYIELLNQYLQNVQSEHHIGHQTAFITLQKAFEEVDPYLKSQILLLNNRALQETQIYYQGVFDPKPIIEAYIDDIDNNKVQRSIHLNQLLVDNIELLTEQDVITIYKHHEESQFRIIQALDLVDAFVQRNKKYETHIHKHLYDTLIKVINQKEFNMGNPDIYIIVSRLITSITKLLKYSFRKTIYRYLIQIVEIIIQKGSSQQSLLFLKIVTGALNKHAHDFFHSQRYSYFLTSTLILLARSLHETNTEPQTQHYSHFEVYKQSELWLQVFVLSRFEFEHSFSKLIFDQVLQTENVFHTVNQLCDTIQYYHHKEGRRKDQSQIIQKAIFTVKTVGKTIKQVTLKRQDFNILTFIGLAIQQSQRVQFSAHDIISVLKTLYALKDWYPDSKLSQLALKRKSELTKKLSLDLLLELANHHNSNEETYLLILYAMNENLQKSKIIITNENELEIFITRAIELDLTSRTAEQILLSIRSLMRQKRFPSLPDEELKPFVQKVIAHMNTSQSLEHALLTLEIVSLMAVKDRYIFLPHNQAIFDKISEMLILVAKDEDLEFGFGIQKENVSRFMKFQFNKSDYTMDEHKKLIEVSASLIQSFSGTISKKQLTNLILVVVSLDEQTLQETILNSIESRIVLGILPQIVELSQQISYLTVQRVGYFLDQLLIKSEDEAVSVASDLIQQLLALLQYPKNKFIDPEVENSIFTVDQIENACIQPIVTLLGKLNDNQLKKCFNQMIKWSKSKQGVSGYNYQNFQTLTFFKAVSKISSELGSKFTKYYGYIFESLAHFFEEFHEIFSRRVKKTCDIFNLFLALKRTHDEPDMYYKLYILNCRHALQCIEMLCVNDRDEYVDTEKFERIAQPLALVLDCPRVYDFENLQDFIDEWVSGSILSLFQLVNDDFKWKNFQYHILQVLQKNSVSDKGPSVEICISILKILNKLIDLLDDRYTVLVNDIVPYVHNLTSTQTQSEEIKTLVNQMITKINKVTGEELSSLLKPVKLK